MFFLADKAYRVRTVPPVVRTIRAAWSPLLWLTSASAFAAVALMWVAMSF